MSSVTMLGFNYCLIAFVGILVSVSGQTHQRCKINDDACILNVARQLYPQIIAGIPSLGIDSSDPTFVELAVGDLSILKYRFMDFYLHGYKDCTLNRIKSNLNQLNMEVDITCPRFFINGKYELSGRLIVLPVEGKGNYTVHMQKHKTNIQLEMKKSKGKDGRDHLTIKNFKLKLEALEPIVFQFDNLFNGQKGLSDTVHKFANQSWKEVSDLVQEPAFNAVFKKLVKNFNKYLKIVAYEDLFL